MAEPTSSLVEKVKVKIMGVEVERDDEGWHFVMAFPVPVGSACDDPASHFNQTIDNCHETWKEMFRASETPEFPNSMLKKDFQEKVRQKVVTILEGPMFGCRTEIMPSVDGDELFLKIGVCDNDDLAKIAEKVEARARIKPEAYEQAKVACPTLMKVGKDFHIHEHHHLDLDGRHLDNTCPAHVTFRIPLRDKLEAFADTEVLRIFRRHLSSFISVAAMERENVVSKFFAVHSWKDLDELHRRGWNDPTLMFRWPAEGITDYIFQYTGVQVAYFFHLFSTFTRWVSAPALLSVLVFTIRKSEKLSREQITLMDSIFGFGLCIWTTIFLARYEQLLNLKIFRWGMKGATHEIVPVRKTFKDEYRGTLMESLQNLLHWFLCLVFIGESIAVVYFLTDLRKQVIQDPAGMTFGIANSTVVLLYKYVITANIKIVDLVWTPLSTWLSKQENFRTDVDLKSAMVVKIYVVKFMVYYYPFAYTILVQPYVEGCDGDDPKDFRGCLLKLRQDLQVLFITQVAFQAFEVVVSVLMTYKTVWSELRNRRQNRNLTYLELQAMMPEYDEAEQIEEYMQLALNFGFISMFGVTCPVICILCWLNNFIVKRLLAYKISYAHRRVIPRVEEGIGSWSNILSFIAYSGVTCTCYIVFFVFDFIHLSFKWKLIAFILSEKAMMALKYGMEGFFGAKMVAQLRVEEHNEEVLDLVLAKNKEP
ncbi:unnamed protein product [Symbiodinium natans]|uniref:Anoctamin transmembrane domain-containing protein n=1 Tax=Symbiodinium natans TaxID=878477 RepID=A0A812P0B8_9DINO|nr:unnamed protein product [Symbiodinium natans]